MIDKLADMFFYPLDKLSFWFTASFVTAAVRFISLTVPINNIFWGVLYRRLPIMSAVTVYLLWVIYGMVSGKYAKINEYGGKLSDAAASVLLSKFFWLSWALSGAAVQYSLGLYGRQIPVFTIIWLVIIFTLFVIKKLRRSGKGK